MSIKQSSLDPTPARTTEPSPVCWHRDRRRDCLRFELSASDIYFFSYQQFVSAHLQLSGDEETLRISFSTHEVILCGRRLSEIAAALQDFSVDWIRTLPARYNSLVETDATSVTGIEVKAIE